MIFSQNGQSDFETTSIPEIIGIFISFTERGTITIQLQCNVDQGRVITEKLPIWLKEKFEIIVTYYSVAICQK